MGESPVLFAHTVAIIYIPPGHPLDAQLVLSCMGHVIRRGYWLHTVLRDWDAVANCLAAGAAQVVVLATRTHRAGDGEWVDVVDEEATRILRQRNSAEGRHLAPGATLNGEVAAYRSGYADGYVDCATLKSNRARGSSS